MPRKPKGMIGDFLKKKTRDAIAAGREIEKRKSTPKRKPSTRTAKQEAAGRGKTGIIGRARTRRDNRLNSIMGEIRSTRKKRK